MRFKFGDGIEDAAREVEGTAHLLMSMARSEDADSGDDGESAALESLAIDLMAVAKGLNECPGEL